MWCLDNIDRTDAHANFLLLLEVPPPLLQWPHANKKYGYTHNPQDSAALQLC